MTVAAVKTGYSPWGYLILFTSVFPGTIACVNVHVIAGVQVRETKVLKDW